MMQKDYIVQDSEVNNKNVVYGNILKKVCAIIILIASIIVAIDIYLLVSNRYLDVVLKNADIHIQSNDKYEALIEFSVSNRLNSFLHSITAHGRLQSSTPSFSTSSASSSSKCDVFSYYKSTSSSYLTQVDLIADVNVNNEPQSQKIQIGITKSAFSTIKDYAFNFIDSPGGDTMRFDCNMDLTIYVFSLLPIKLQVPISQKMTLNEFKFSASIDVKEVNSKKNGDTSIQRKEMEIRENKFEIPSLTYTDLMIKTNTLLAIKTNDVIVTMHVPKLLVELGKNRVYRNDTKSSALVLELAPVAITLNEYTDLDFHVYCDPSSSSKSALCSLHYPFSEVLPDVIRGQANLNLLMNGENYLYSVLNNDHDIEIYTGTGSILDELTSNSRELLSNEDAYPATCVSITFDNSEVSNFCGGLGESYFGLFGSLNSFDKNVLEFYLKAFWGDNYGATGMNINVDSIFQYNNQYFFNGTFVFNEDNKFMNHSIYVFTNDDDSIFQQNMDTNWEYIQNSFIQGNSYFYTTINDDIDRSYTTANFTLWNFDSNVVLTLDTSNVNLDSNDEQMSSFDLSSLVNLNITNGGNWLLIIDHFTIKVATADDFYENTLNVTVSLVTDDVNDGVFTFNSADIDTNGLVYRLLTSINFSPVSIVDSSATDVTGFNMIFNETVNEISGFADGNAYGSSPLNWAIDVYNANILDNGDQIISPTFDVSVNCTNNLGDIIFDVETTKNGEITFNMEHGINWNANQDKGYFNTFTNTFNSEWANKSFSSSWTATTEADTYQYKFDVEDTEQQFDGSGSGEAFGTSALVWEFSLQSTFTADNKELASPSCYFKSNISSPSEFFFTNQIQNRVNNQINWYQSQTTSWTFLSSGSFNHQHSMWKDNKFSNRSTTMTYTQVDNNNWDFDYKFKDTDRTLLISGNGDVNSEPNKLILQLEENTVSRNNAIIDEFDAVLSASLSDDNNIGSFSIQFNNNDKVDQMGTINTDHSLAWNTNHNSGNVQVNGSVSFATSTAYDVFSKVTYSLKGSNAYYDSLYSYDVTITEKSSDFDLDASGGLSFNNISYFDFALTQCDVSVDNSVYYPSGEVKLVTSNDCSTGTFSISGKNTLPNKVVNYNGFQLLSWDINDDVGLIEVESNMATLDDTALQLLYNFTMDVNYKTVVFSPFDTSKVLLLSTGVNAGIESTSTTDYSNYYAFEITMNEYVGNFNQTGSGYLFEDSSLTWLLYFNSSDNEIFVDNEDYGSPFVIIYTNISDVVDLGTISFQQGWYQADGVQVYAIQESFYWDYSTPSDAGTLVHTSKMYINDDSYDNDLLYQGSQILSYSEGNDSYYGYFLGIKSTTPATSSSDGVFEYNKFSLDTEGSYYSSSPLDWMFSISTLNTTINGEQYFDMTGLIQMDASTDGDIGHVIMASTIYIQENEVYDGSNQVLWSYTNDSLFTLGYEGDCTANHVDIFNIDFTIGVEVNLEQQHLPTPAPTFASVILKIQQVLENFPLTYDQFMSNEAVYILTLTETIVASTNSKTGNSAAYITSDNVKNLQVSPSSSSSSSSSSSLRMLSTSLYLSYYIETSNPAMSSSMLSTALTAAVTSGTFNQYLQQYSTTNGVPALAACDATTPNVINQSPTPMPSTAPAKWPTPRPTQISNQSQHGFPVGAIAGISAALGVLAIAALYLLVKYKNIKFSTIRLSAFRIPEVFNAKRVAEVPNASRITILDQDHRISILDHRISMAEGVSNPINSINPVSDVNFTPDNEL